MHRLDSATTTLILDEAGDGLPRIVYWGGRLRHAIGAGALAADRGRALPHGGLDEDVPLSLVPEPGAGFMGQPGLAGSRDGRDWLTRFEAAVTSNADTITVAARDQDAGLELTIDLSLHAASGVLTTRTRVVNTGTAPFTLDWAAAGVYPLPARIGELLTLEGRWSREFAVRRQPFPDQALIGDNRTGRTSHHNFPGLAAGTPGFTEQNGEVFGFHLAWSGNHRWLAERLRDDRRQIQLGELPLPGEIVLAPGEAYASPPAHAAWSDNGLSGMAEAWHTFMRAEILPRSVTTPRPVHVNTWEAFYFDHDPKRLAIFADRAAALGCERFVLDDGWFRGRHDDSRALGDWTVDADAYPHGLGPLIAHVNKLGMAFGLWVEPEMANPDSDLLRAHPDWILGVPGRHQPMGRQQYVLDLTRAEVADYLFASLDALLSAHPIAYLKWDMNRDLTHPAHAGRAAVHAQTRALYALVDRVRAAHPDVEIESCASGGARADYGILRRANRIWPSDCNDAVERQAIHAGFGLFFPPEIMGAHIGPNPSHTTGRTIDFDFQGATALFGHFGLELDITALDEPDAERIAAWIALYKEWRALLHHGRPVRLDADEDGVRAHGVVAADRERALFCHARSTSARAPVPAPLRLAGLKPECNYHVKLLQHTMPPPFAARGLPAALAGHGTVLRGEWLMRGAGLQLPITPPQHALLIAADAVG
ncbi:alpha-galactosidase [Salinisphaera sp.]|uniref:alpha-galactosidase n=1 Tax=Salinisphaera sp. TaxID=1914330 RepID=UPI002D770203|nr:alpha-galactosidase [Salinisphaera sp.]HET7313559.1 alpha-galactosidase [Salinisphaera sp.]